MVREDFDIPVKKITKNELLYCLYPLEYVCKISGFTYETDKITDLILHIENEIKDGTPREVICAKNCDLIESEVQGHGWVEWTCLASNHRAPLGKWCNVTRESYVKLSEHEFRKRWGL